jgi:hypothetical protein
MIKINFPFPSLMPYWMSFIEYNSSLNLMFVLVNTNLDEVDIPKFTFHTHEANYELLVMPFGIYNDPSTF